MTASVKGARAVIFDLYDTLAYLDPRLYSDAKARMAALAGVDAADFLRAWRHQSRPSAEGTYGSTLDRAIATLEELGVPVDPEVAHRIVEEEHRLQYESVVLFRNSKRVLGELRENGYKLGLITNTPKSTERVPSHLSISGLLDVTVFSFQVHALKPHPGIYLEACRLLQVVPSQCIYVGDGNDRELDGAHDVGMITVLLMQKKNEITSSMQSDYHDFVITDIEEVLGLLGVPGRQEA